jgi:integrase
MDKHPRRAENGTARLRMRKTTWYVRWTFDGQLFEMTTKQRGTVGRTKAETILKTMNRDMEDNNFDPTTAKYIALRSELLSQDAPPPKPATAGPIDFAALFAQFTKTKVKHGDISEVTSLKHDALYRKIVVFQGNLTTKAGAIAMVNHLREIQRPITSNGCQDLLREAAQWMVMQGLLTSNPFDEIKKLKIRAAGKRATGHLSSEEIALFMTTLRTKPEWALWGDFCTVLLNMGPRISELIGLQWERVRFDLDGVEFSKALGRSPTGGARIWKDTKTGSERMVRFNSTTREMFTRLSVNRTDDPDGNPYGLVFLSPEGKPIDDANFRNRCWIPVCIAAGLTTHDPTTGKSRHRHPPKSARHGFGRRLYKAGLDPHSVAYAMGHSSPRTSLENYGHDNYSPPIPEID